MASAKKKAVKKTDQSTSNNSSDTTDDDIAPVDPAKLAVYKGWLKNRKSGNLVAIRDTQAYDDDGDSKVLKGQAIKIPSEDDEIDVSVHGGNNGPEIEFGGNEGSTVYDLVDLDFKTYDGTYKDKLANIKKYTNSKGKISFVPTVNVISIPDLDYPRVTLKAGKEVTLNYPDLMINGDGEYVVEVEDNNGHVFQVPYNQITG